MNDAASFYWVFAVRAQTFWKTVVADRTDFLDRLIALFAEHGVRYCLVGGPAVNAYVEPLVSLDLDIERLLESYPHLRDRIPSDILAQLE
jgi:hypothetical protein